MGEIITIIMIFLTLLTIFCLHKTFDKRGLYFSVVIFSLISFILSFKISVVLKMNINTSIIILPEIFTIFYIFIIKYGYKDINDLLKITFYANITTSIIIAIMNIFVPTITETISINMQGTFEYNYKILIIYPFMMLLSQYIIIKLYQLVSKIQNYIYISVSLTYIITGLIYTIIFYVLCYLDIMEIKYSLFLGISTYIAGLAITVIDTIFINYFVRGKKVIK